MCLDLSNDEIWSECIDTFTRLDLFVLWEKKSVGRNPGSNQSVYSTGRGAIIVSIPSGVCVYLQEESINEGGSICQLMGTTKENKKRKKGNNKMGKAKKETRV